MHTAATVTRSVFARADSPDRPIPTVIDLGWDPADPCAVRAVFGTTGSGQVVWLFGRDLLRTGLAASELVGDGDVQLGAIPDATTTLDLEREPLVLVLSSPDGRATFHLDRSRVVAFLADTDAVVPQDAEERIVRVAAARWLADFTSAAGEQA